MIVTTEVSTELSRPGGEAPGIDFTRFDDGPALAQAYQNASPFPHIVLDGRFPVELLHGVLAEIHSAAVEPEGDFYGSFKKRRISDVLKMGPFTRRLIEDLNSAPFLRFMEAMTGIDGLIPDPYLEGGGVHQIGAGGFLKVHTDFNWHRRLGLHRRVNLLVYLNEDWADEWNGALELWDKDVQSCGARIRPLFNRMAAFSTTDESYHGHPDPLACPEDRTRNSVALYYYSATRPDSEVKYKASEMTNYRERPTEHFEGAHKHALHQMQIKHPHLRKILNLLKITKP